MEVDYTVYSEDELKRMKFAAEVNLLNTKAALEEENRVNQERVNAEAKAHAKHSCVYTFYDPVKPESVVKCMTEIGVMTRRSPGEDIKIILNSPGGNVLDGLALFDFICKVRAMGHKVEIETLGTAASMGAVLMQAADVRSMGANSWMMIHEVSTGSHGTTSEMREDVEKSERIENRITEIFVSRSKLTKRKIKTNTTKKDWWLTAEEALEHGLIDNITTASVLTDDTLIPVEGQG